MSYWTRPKARDRVVLLDWPDSVAALETGKIYSMHDFDLAVTLKLLKKLKLLDSVRIIAVPMGYDGEKAMEEVSAFISTLSSENASRSSCTGHRRG